MDSKLVRDALPVARNHPRNYPKSRGERSSSFWMGE
ncbi:unnamed protein product [Mycena citricolor]|uniref:Uncharacterized protein n=1 Tax=Mycena citricolor TaxID=2018698 RepID=A0AAD2HVN3_9AGAR|nr:unnamed protein product [Mycena citricolor]